MQAVRNQDIWENASEPQVERMMASAAPYGIAFGNILLRNSQDFHNSERPTVSLRGKRREGIALKAFGPTRGCSLQIKSVLDKKKGNVNGTANGNNANNNGFKDPARLALEKLFIQTQKLEEQMVTGSSNANGSNYDLNLEGLESDLQIALAALKAKEEELQVAERAVAFDRREVEQARKDLDFREKEVVSAQILQRRLEEELKKSRDDFVVQAEELKESKLRLDEKEREISSVRHALAEKEEELGRLKKELAKKDEEIVKIAADLQLRDELIGQADEVIAKQESEIRELQRILKERENELVETEKKRRAEEQKLKVSETTLEDRVVAWYMAQQELKNLAEEVSKYRVNSLATEEELKRARNLLAELKGELTTSQKSLESSRQRLKAQQAQLELQRMELSKQKNKIQSHVTSLRHAQLEVGSEREKLRLAETYCKELEHHLANERCTVDELQKELHREKSSLNQAIEEVRSLKKELEQRNAAFSDAQTLLQLKESELVAARLEMQCLKSDISFVQHNLSDRDKDLMVAQNNLKNLQEEIFQFKSLMRDKEDQLLKATIMLKDKDEQVKTMQLNLNDNKLKLSEATSVVEHIADLTRILVESAKEGNVLTMDEDSLIMQSNCELFATNRALLETKLQLQHIQEMSVEDLRKQNQSEAELKAMKECLREKEKELLEAHRALALKNQELKTLLNRWDIREKELAKMREEVIQEANSLNSLHAIIQKRIGDKTLGELALEKLELEAAHLDIEAATSALRNLADLSHKLLTETKTSLDLSTDFIVLPNNMVDLVADIGAEKGVSKANTREDLASLKERLIERDVAIGKTTNAVKDLSKLTKQLISEAGIKHFEVTHRSDVTNNDIAANKVIKVDTRGTSCLDLISLEN